MFERDSDGVLTLTGEMTFTRDGKDYEIVGDDGARMRFKRLSRRLYAYQTTEEEEEGEDGFIYGVIMMRRSDASVWHGECEALSDDERADLDLTLDSAACEVTDFATLKRALLHQIEAQIDAPHARWERIRN